MRAIFMGTPEFAVPSLRALLDSPYEVCAVFTQPDRPAGRGQKLQPSPVKRCAQSHGIPVYQPEKVKAEENRSVLERYQPDFLVVVAFGQILPGWLLHSARVAPVNVHASMLPKYRGAAPIIWAILKGDVVTGVTTMLMDEHLDTGPILLRREVAIPETMTAGELASQLSTVGAELLIPTLDGFSMGTLQAKSQDNSQASLAPRIEKEMAAIAWSRHAREIHNQIRAFNPWPLAYTTFHNQRVQISHSFAESTIVDTTLAAGTYLGPTESGIRVKCGGETVLEVLAVKLEGKSLITGREFASGSRLQPGLPLFV